MCFYVRMYVASYPAAIYTNYVHTFARYRHTTCARYPQYKALSTTQKY